jgi:photoactive yellow protein
MGRTYGARLAGSRVACSGGWSGSPPGEETADMSAMFGESDLVKAFTLNGEDLDQLPFGVIVVDRKGTIIEYNAYERSMAGLGSRDVIGLNFFHDLAPCTAIKDFEGRFEAFLDSDDTSIEPFQFTFAFARGAQRVAVIFVRLSNHSDRATICVQRSAVGE